MRILFVIFSLAFIFSCSGKNEIPAGIMPPKKMQAVLWDMISAGEFLNAYVNYKDSIDKEAESLKRYGQVFQFHKISKAEFDKSWLYYRQHPEKMRPILDSLSKRQSPLLEADSTGRSPDTMLNPVDSLRKRLLKPGRLS